MISSGRPSPYSESSVSDVYDQTRLSAAVAHRRLEAMESPEVRSEDEQADIRLVAEDRDGDHLITRRWRACFMEASRTFGVGARRDAEKRWHARPARRMGIRGGARSLRQSTDHTL